MNKNRGITLVALVVTIIVLLILAGISISMLTGQNGIIKRAAEAKNQTEISQKKEKTDLASMEELIEENINGKNVEQVTDLNPGVLEIEDGNTYVVNSIEDLVFFAYDVRNGNNYSGKTVKLGLSLDFNSVKSYVDAFRTDYGKYGYDGELKTLLTSGEGFIPIGLTADKEYETTNGWFTGTFDGDNFSIINCYMNKDVTGISSKNTFSFFGRYLWGEIKNLRLLNINYTVVNSDLESAVSGLVTASSDTSKITNCFITGNIKQISKGNGNVNCSGFVSYNKGSMENCYNLVNIQAETSNTTSGCYIGGIAVNHENGYIKNSYNSGNIEAKVANKKTEIGGIVRITGVSENKIYQVYNSGKINVELLNNVDLISIGGIVGKADNGGNIDIKNVYNSGDIKIKGLNQNQVSQLCIAGIVGEKSNQSDNLAIQNAYNIGLINVEKVNDTASIGEILGLDRRGITKIRNCFYPKESSYNGVGTESTNTENISISEIKSAQELLEKLNQDEKNIWKNDEKNINSGYPIFIWQ